MTSINLIVEADSPITDRHDSGSLASSDSKTVANIVMPSNDRVGMPLRC